MKPFFPTPILLFLLFTAAHTLAGTSTLELVQSVPMDTPIGEEGLRSTEEAWLGIIRGARESLCVEQFYISDGRVGDEAEGAPGREALAPVLEALEEAGGRGVAVRVIVEQVFLDKYPHTVARLDSLEGIQCRVLDFRRFGGGIQHGKFMIADSRVAYVGSANWDWRALTHIHELGVVVRDEYCGGWIQQLFDLDWRLCREETPGAVKVPLYPDPFPVTIGEARVAPVASPPGWLPSESRRDDRALIEMIDGARESLCVQALAYGLEGYDGHYWDELDRALRRAAHRGVRVELLLSDWTLKEKHLPWLRSLALLPNLRLRISTVPEHHTGTIPFARVEHAKYLVADGHRAWIGSSNWEGDYFHSGRNLGLVIEEGQIPGQLQGIFNRSFGGSWSKEFEGCE